MFYLCFMQLVMVETPHLEFKHPPPHSIWNKFKGVPEIMKGCLGLGK